MKVLNFCLRYCPDKIPYIVGPSLGSGVDGEVFEIEGLNNKVVKFGILYDSGDADLQSTYQSFCKVLDHLESSHLPAYARVYSHKYLGEFTQGHSFILYCYLMDKLIDISQDERKVFHALISHEDRGIIKNFSKPKIKEMVRGMATALDFDAERVTFFCSNIKDTGIIHGDIHERNIMKDNEGNFKLVDFDRAQLTGD